MLFLSPPSEKYKDSFLEAQAEFLKNGENLDFDFAVASEDFPKFVQQRLYANVRTNLPPGVVPESDFWLIDEEEFIGDVRVRHELNEKLRLVGGHIGYDIRPSKRRQGYGKEILRLGLEKAKGLGLRRALLTCTATNVGSRKIIEYNGGVLEDQIEVEIHGQLLKKLRYWIEL